jgi:hypothetical protein
MNTQQPIRKELEELGADQLQQWQGKLPQPSLSAERLQAIADAARTAATEPASHRIGHRPTLYWQWAAAAAIALLLGLALWLNPTSPSSNQPPGLALEELSDTEILAYLEANIDELEWELLEDAVLTETRLDITPLDALPDTAIESYLETADDWLLDYD